MCLLDQSGVTGGGLDPYSVHDLFVNMDNMWTERFGNLRLSCHSFRKEYETKYNQYLFDNHDYR